MTTSADTAASELMHAAADECMSPDQRNLFDQLGCDDNDCDFYARLFRCVMKRVSTAPTTPVDRVLAEQRDFLEGNLDTLEDSADTADQCGHNGLAQALRACAHSIKLLYAAPTTGSAPVAWRVRGYAQFKTGKPNAWRYEDGASKPLLNDPNCCDIEPLYAAPPANAPVASDDQIFEIVAKAIGNPLLAEDMKEGFAMHVEPEDWLKVFRIAASMGGDRT